MTKNLVRFYISAAAVLAAFCVIAFVVPFAKTAVFWLSLVFGVIAIVVQLYTMPRAMAGDTRSKFYGFPTLRISFIYLGGAANSQSAVHGAGRDSSRLDPDGAVPRAALCGADRLRRRGQRTRGGSQAGREYQETGIRHALRFSRRSRISPSTVMRPSNRSLTSSPRSSASAIP